jgi:hypothetical protein
MAQSKISNNYSLHAHDIYFNKSQAVGNCPAELQDLFKLVISIQDLKYDYFGGYDTEMTSPNHWLNSSTEFEAFSSKQ